MVKQDLIEELCERTDLTQSQALEVIDTITAIAGEQFIKGESIILRGFGTFKVVEVKEKVGRNISKGTQIVIPAHKVVKFQVSKDIKNKLKK